MPDEAAKGAVIRALIQRFDEALLDWMAAERRENEAKKVMAEAQAAKAVAEATHGDCFTTAKLFDFDLLVERDAHYQKQIEMNTAAAPAPLSPAALPTPRTKTIREFVYEAARRAYPNSVRASGLRQQLLNAGIETHEKTIGMTLYRLLKEGKVWRQGRDWYYSIASDPDNADEDPGDEPGLLDAAE